MSFQEDNLDVEQQSNDRWLISYADLVTLLLALFIVLYAASDKERAARISESFSGTSSSSDGILPGNRSKENDATSKIETNFLQDPILKSKAKLRRSGEGTVISLSEAGFFAPGEAVLNKGGEEVLASIAKSLGENKSLVRIEGHTDSTPISTEKYRSNWELSTARASTVLAKLIERGVEPRMLSAAGYGGFRPVGDNSTEEGRARNRRVDVVILKK